MDSPGSIIMSWREAQRLHQRMDDEYERMARVPGEGAADDHSLRRAQVQADVLGKRYERLCERICRSDAPSFEDVLAKLQCATQCIREILPEGTDPEQDCDIELRFVFAVQRDVRRLIAKARRSQDRRRPGPIPRNREPTSSARGRPLRDVGTIEGTGRAT